MDRFLPAAEAGGFRDCGMRETFSMTRAARDVIVIGGGIIGVCVAQALTESGARVTVLVDGWPGRGTSAASLAWVNAANKTPEAYNRLNAAGMRAYGELRDRLGPDSGIHL